MSAVLIEAIIVGFAKYGPDWITAVSALLKKKTVTIEEVEALFANVKPFEAYDIKKPE